MPPPIQMGLSILPKDEIWFLCVCHHILTGLYMFKIFNVPVFLSITVTPSVKLQVQHAVCQFFQVI